MAMAPVIEIKVKLTPDDMRKLLPKPLQELFDGLVKNLVELSGMEEQEAQWIIAGVFMDYLKAEHKKVS
jgi:hypothetical protein